MCSFVLTKAAKLQIFTTRVDKDVEQKKIDELHNLVVLRYGKEVTLNDVYFKIIDGYQLAQRQPKDKSCLNELKCTERTIVSIHVNICQ